MPPWPIRVASWWSCTLHYEMILMSVGIPCGMMMMMLKGNSSSHSPILGIFESIFRAQWHLFTHMCGWFYMFVCIRCIKTSLLHICRQVKLDLSQMWGIWCIIWPSLGIKDTPKGKSFHLYAIGLTHMEEKRIKG